MTNQTWTALAQVVHQDGAGDGVHGGHAAGQRQVLTMVSMVGTGRRQLTSPVRWQRARGASAIWLLSFQVRCLFVAPQPRALLRVTESALLQTAGASLCANWEVHRGINIVEGRVNPSCNLVGTQAPCGAGSSYPDPSYTDYLWLGQVDSLGECQHEALKQADDPCAEAPALHCACLPHFALPSHTVARGTLLPSSPPRPLAVCAQ